jgi:hypothetical protein
LLFPLSLILLFFAEHPYRHQSRPLPPTQISASICTSGLSNLFGAMLHGAM